MPLLRGYYAMPEMRHAAIRHGARPRPPWLIARLHHCLARLLLPFRRRATFFPPVPSRWNPANLQLFICFSFSCSSMRLIIFYRLVE